MKIRRPPEQRRGRVERVKHVSNALANNPWGDPCERDLLVYLPYGYDTSDRHYPILWYLAAFSNSGESMANWRGFSDNLAQRLDRLIASGAMGPVIVAAPDAFTTLGGNQYINSPAVGAYADYLQQELVPLAERRYRVLPGREHRAAFGKSSGGYGALRLGMDYPDLWGAVASHAGDAHFELVYRSDFPQTAAVLSRFDGDGLAFLRAFWASNAPSAAEFHTLMTLCMAASYDPDPDAPAAIRLPFSLDTVELDDACWQRWLAHDPIHRIKEASEALKTLRGVYIDCGNRDQYHIHHGCRILHRLMGEFGVAHHYEEFDGNHSNIDHRIETSLPFLYRALSHD